MILSNIFGWIGTILAISGVLLFAFNRPWSRLAWFVWILAKICIGIAAVMLGNLWLLVFAIVSISIYIFGIYKAYK